MSQFDFSLPDASTVFLERIAEALETSINGDDGVSDALLQHIRNLRAETDDVGYLNALYDIKEFIEDRRKS